MLGQAHIYFIPVYCTLNHDSLNEGALKGDDKPSISVDAPSCSWPFVETGIPHLKSFFAHHTEIDSGD